MLGRLLHTAATSLNPAAYGRNPFTLESATDEEHTRSLLFPDSTLLQHSSHAYPLQNGPPSPLTQGSGGFDDRGGLDLDLNKDFRVIIAQDALGDQDEPCVLLDTQASVDQSGGGPRTPQTGPSKTSPRHRRGASQYNMHSPLSPTSPTQTVRNSTGNAGGAFLKPRIRSATISLNESDAGPAQDTRDDTKTLLNCMFGSSLLGHKGTSTKMHILNGDGSPGSSAGAKVSLVREGDGTIRKDTRQRVPLSRAHTYGAQSAVPSVSQNRAVDSSRSQNEAVLLTRVFAVNLPEPKDTDEFPQTPGRSPDTAYPFPDMGSTLHDPHHHRKLKKLKEKKTPAYAVAIVVKLPSSSKVVVSRPSSRRASNVSSTRPQGSLSSSLGSELPSSWTFLDAFPVPSARALAESIDARIDALVEHWDAVVRTLSTLEKEASQIILKLLQERDLASRVPAPKVPKEKSMQRTNQRIIQLMPYALFAHKELFETAIHAASRLCLALRIPRVITGQNRWSIWQDEARWIGRWAGGKDQNFFFFTLLTAFLGNHTEWLGELGPEWYRRRYAHYKKHRANNELMPSRTVIVSADKMAARRLIFLLSSFLPSVTRKDTVGSPLRPTSATHSPPMGHVSRQQSLRRTLNRRAMDNRLAATSPDRRGLSTSLSSAEGESFDSIEGIDPSDLQLHRTNSDARSIRTAKLALPGNELSTRKSSAATTATITPNPTTPIAHFTTSSGPGDYFMSRGHDNNNDSAATTNLAGNLKRHESANTSIDSEKASGSGRWGTMLSGMWSNKNESSSDSNVTVPSIRHGDPHKPFDSPTKRRQTRLAYMAEEVGQKDGFSVPTTVAQQDSRPASPDGDGTESIALSQSDQDSLPIKLMVDENDGVVDVGIDVPGVFSTSVDSPMCSPPPRDAHRTPSSVTSTDGIASLHSHASTANFSNTVTIESQSNVAGWLRTYHEDFVLQAVRPSPDLENQIKASMSAEPTPPTIASEKPEPSGPKWVDVCSVLIADARTFTIKRLILRRQLPSPLTDTADNTSNGIESDDGTKKQPSIKIPSNQSSNLVESITVEPVMDMDSTLIDAVERVVARNLHPSRANSPSPGSRSHSRTPSSSTTTATLSTPKDTLPPVLEVSRGECRKVITNALKDIVRTVTDEINRKEGGRDIKTVSSNMSTGVQVSTSTTGNNSKARPKSSGESFSEENTLREGIKRWLKSVENDDIY